MWDCSIDGELLESFKTEEHYKRKSAIIKDKNSFEYLQYILSYHCCSILKKQGTFKRSLLQKDYNFKDEELTNLLKAETDKIPFHKALLFVAENMAP